MRFLLCSFPLSSCAAVSLSLSLSLSVRSVPPSVLGCSRHASIPAWTQTVPRRDAHSAVEASFRVLICVCPHRPRACFLAPLFLLASPLWGLDRVVVSGTADPFVLVASRRQGVRSPEILIVCETASIALSYSRVRVRKSECACSIRSTRWARGPPSAQLVSLECRGRARTLQRVGQRASPKYITAIKWQSPFVVVIRKV